METKGRVWKYGDNIDTDVIIPARYLNRSDPNELAGHCMEDLDPSFVLKVKAGDIIIAGKNFGCGSSREHAPLAIKAAGISCIVASNFARIFFRNAINIGLPILECAQAVSETAPGDKIKIDFSTGNVQNLTSGKTYKAEPFPEFIQDLIRSGGLIESIKKQRSAR